MIATENEKLMNIKIYYCHDVAPQAEDIGLLSSTTFQIASGVCL